jgi:hypothetical protein
MPAGPRAKGLIFLPFRSPNARCAQATPSSKGASMSIRIALLIAAGFGAAMVLNTGAGAEMAAPKKPVKPKIVTVTGCPQKGFAESCTIIKAPKDTTYNISGANPPAPIGKKVRLKGTVTDSHTFCGGLTLIDIRWTAVKGRCPATKK